jgi:hypothetical protein
MLWYGHIATKLLFYWRGTHCQMLNPSAGVENFVGQAQAQGFLNFLNPSPVSDLPSPNL